MSIHQLNIYGDTLLEVTLERFRVFEPPEGYYLAFSGGKDSTCVKALADMAGVKYDAHYSVTSVDPPELVRFIKEKHPDVKFDKRYWPDDYKNEALRGKQITMWNLIPEKRMPPTRIARYCCDVLKEASGENRFVITGVRKGESVKRAKRGGLELAEKKSHRLKAFDPDEPTDTMMYHCQFYARKILNPIIDWTDAEVWEFIKEFDIPYCELYDQGFKRVGCIGCPIAGKTRAVEFERYPKYEKLYKKAFGKMLEGFKRKGTESTWETADDVFNWWLKTN
jgi:phosphoadenosine phosphosulfate reductase